MNKKKSVLLFCLMFTLIVPICTAELDVNMASYDPVTKLAKLEVSNTGSTGYSGIKLAIDSMPEFLIIDNLSPQNSASIPQIIEPGSHNLTLTTKEGKSITKTLTFSKTEEQLKEEKERTETLRELRKEELEGLAKETEEKLGGQIAEEAEKMKGIESVRSQIETAETKEKVSLKNYLLYGLAVFAPLLLIPVYIFLRRKGFFKKHVTEEQEESWYGKSTKPVQPEKAEPEGLPRQAPQEEYAKQPPPIKEKTEKETAEIPKETLYKKSAKTTQQGIKRDTTKLKIFVTQSLKKGYTPYQIAIAVEKAGWTKEEIKEAFKEAQSSGGATSK